MWRFTLERDATLFCHHFVPWFCDFREHFHIHIFGIISHCAGEDPVTTKKAGSYNSSEVIPSPDPKESDLLSTQKQNSVKVVHTKPTNNKSFIAPVLVPQDSPDGKDFTSSRRETISATRASAGMPLKPSHLRRLSNNFDMEKTIEPEPAENASKENDSTIKNDEEKSEKTSLQSGNPDQGTGQFFLIFSSCIPSILCIYCFCSPTRQLWPKSKAL